MKKLVFVLLLFPFFINAQVGRDVKGVTNGDTLQTARSLATHGWTRSKLDSMLALILLRVNYSDTATMLNPYFRTAQAAAYKLISDSGRVGGQYVTGGSFKSVIDSISSLLSAKQNSLGYTPLNPANNLSEVTAATARTNLGATTVGGNIFTLTNPSAIKFIRINADNTVTARTAAEMISDLGAATLAGTQTFTGYKSFTQSATNAAININYSSGSDPSVKNAGDVWYNGVASEFRVYDGGAIRVLGYVDGTQTFTNKTMSGASNTFSNIPQSAITSLTTDLAAKALAASPTITGTAALPIVTLSGKVTNYNGINTVTNGVPSLVATIDATAQTANIGTSTLYAVPTAGAYRVSIYITVTSAGTTSTMPSTTITYTDGNAGTNSHSTTTTATNTGNSVTTTFLQTTYVLYAKASTNIQYATGGYASTGSAMQYALRIRVEAL